MTKKSTLCFAEATERKAGIATEAHNIVPLGVDKTSECSNSFALVPRANGKVRLCLNPLQLNKALIRPIHGGPTLNYILPKLTGVKDLTLIDTNSGYHNLKDDEKHHI